MVATRDREMQASHCIVPQTTTDLKLLKAGAVYGANASGKSNLIKKMEKMVPGKLFHTSKLPKFPTSLFFRVFKEICG
jgi:hypothetical protein